MERFKAYRIFNENNKIEGRVTDLGVDDLMPGEVVFKNAYSSVNYKDALAATGVGGKVIRKYPLVGGIDAAGVVLSSSDARFKPGDEVASFRIIPLKADRADVKVANRWSGGVFTSEVGRKLTTGSKFDVQFSDLNAQYAFGFAAFDNAQVRHAVHYGALQLRFAK